MIKTIYLIRHSGPFIKLYDYETQTWDEFNKNMISHPHKKFKPAFCRMTQSGRICILFCAY